MLCQHQDVYNERLHSCIAVAAAAAAAAAAAPPRSQVCPGPGGYRTFKFSFQVRIRHRYVKKIIDWSTALDDESYNVYHTSKYRDTK